MNGERKRVRKIDGPCVIREHTADGAYVGLCYFGVRNGICPRHGVVADYPTGDDRDVDPDERRFKAHA